MTESSLLQEIDEDLQRQKIEALWKRYGLYILGGALLIVLGTGVYTSWKAWREQTRQTATADFLALVDSKEADSAKRMTALENFAHVHEGVSQGTLAQLQAAAIALKDGKTDKAITLYDALAADTKADPLFRQLADLLSVQAQLDKGDPKALMVRLNPLLTDSPWRFSAKEYTAHLALKAGDKPKAIELFTSLAQDASTSPALAERANDMLRWLNEGM